MSREPTRIADLSDGASSEDQFMRSVIRAERTDLPSDAKMQELAGRLGPIVAKEGVATSMALSWRWMIGVAVVTVFAAGAVVFRSHSVTAGPSSAEAVAHDPVDAKETSGPLLPETTTRAAASGELAAPAIPVESLPSVSALPRARPSASAAASMCTGEIELVDRADAALRTGNAKVALDLAREHAERCPSGAFIQERERIAIEALARLGRQDDVRARARAFEERFPTSPHIRRIRSLVENDPE